MPFAHRCLTLRLSLDLEWQPLEEYYSLAAKQMDQLILRAEKLSKLGRRPHKLESPSASDGQQELITLPLLNKKTTQASPPDEAKLPCVVLPDIRTSRFFDRIDAIEKMDEYFGKVDLTTKFASLALHGLGGVGKSTVALRYAEKLLQRGAVDALFWVRSEKLVNISQSFTDIALRLKLPDARQGDHEENRALLLNWLQKTRR